VRRHQAKIDDGMEKSREKNIHPWNSKNLGHSSMASSGTVSNRRKKKFKEREYEGETTQVTWEGGRGLKDVARGKEKSEARHRTRDHPEREIRTQKSEKEKRGRVPVTAGRLV